jgi:hypothetical protein
LKPWASKKDYERYDELSHESGRKLRNTALQEALRVLEDKGVLIWQGGEKEDYKKALELGFEIKELKDRKETGCGYFHPSYNFIFEKENLQSKNSGAYNSSEATQYEST